MNTKPTAVLAAAISSVTAAPLDPATHETLGDAWREAGRPIPASACYRTAFALGGDTPLLTLKLAVAELQAGRPREAAKRLDALPADLDGEIGEQAAEIRRNCHQLPETPLTDFDHNRHFRMASLAAFVTGLGEGPGYDLLDVGGGDGLLALHLPQARYRLAEPDTNGLRGEYLPFPEQSVDVVCACHVLEHVPPAARFDFLDALRLRARKHLVLLNPFLIAGSRFEERLHTLIDITGAGWAKEHLECGLPELAVVEEYAADRGLTVNIQPNGSMPAAFLAVFVNHYAELAGRAGELPRINRYLNSLAPDTLTSPTLPAAMMVHFPLT